MKAATTSFKALVPERRASRPLFAIGDIHGHADALAALLARINDIVAQEYADQMVDLVYLGDFVDRGPDPLGVLSLADRGLGLETVRETALMGNHDEFLIGAAEIGGRSLDLEGWALWLANGGRQTLAALGGLGLGSSPEAIRAALGPDLCGFLASLELSYRSGDVFCAHAGLDPTAPIEAQTERDLVWIREPFLSLAEDDGAHWTPGVTVVHGHTPTAYGQFAHRIGVDTGGFHTGVFTAVEIRDAKCRFHRVSRD